MKVGAVARVLSASVIDGLGTAMLARLRALAPIVAGDSSPAKYLDAERWIHVCARRAVALGLHTRERARILDLGTGSGYFPLVCRSLGHEVVATDCADRLSLFRDVSAMVGVDVHDVDVQAMRQLPSDLRGFDAVTAFMVTFNGHRHAPWGIAEWQFFLDDALARLNVGGVLCLELNREPDAPTACSPELEQYLVDHRGAEMTGHWPHRAERGAHRLVFRRR